MHRRDFLQLGALTAFGGPLVVSSAAQQAQTPISMPMPMPASPSTAGPAELSGTEFTLKIAPVTVELAPNRIVSTIGYNGISPGPRLRMKEGVPVTVAQVEKKTVPQQVKHRSAKAKAPRSGGPKECHGILPMRGLSHSSVQAIRTLASFRMRSC